MIRTILVDDHAVVRLGYRSLLEIAGDIVVIAEAETGEEAYQSFLAMGPDVIVMDLALPGMGGLEVTRRILRRDASAKVLVFSMYDDLAFVRQALQAGARGYVSKNSAPEVLVTAVRQTAAGERYLEPRLARELRLHSRPADRTPLAGLSTREFEIFCLLARGQKIGDIAERLSLSYKTVANYYTQIKSKVEAKTLADITRLAIRHGVLEP